MKQHTIISLLLFCCLLPVAAAGEITVVFIPKVTGNAFFESANEGAQRFAERIGFNVEYTGSPEASVDRQRAIIASSVKRRVNAICISSLDATALDDDLKAAMAAGVKVTTWDSDVSGDARTLMVSQGTPDVLGKMLVDMAVKSLDSRGIDPGKDKVQYVWHYSRANVADQNSWRDAGEAYIKKSYPNWTNVNPDNYYSDQDPKKALQVGEEIFADHPEIDVVICNDSTALPGQCQAAENFGLDQKSVSITGFAAPNAIKDYCRAGIIERWGLWDCQIQGALGCYLAYYLSLGENVKVGTDIDVPEIGTVKVYPNSILDTDAYTDESSGVVLLPERVEFTLENMDNYDF